ncbi:hypothetical protein KFE25_002997 [Diacronema lutheri]|uniref:Abnormal spindle-like microcephaly-associated protein ASH domain-containing protein n=1 Tax=Diacronema lutheri TaxID=2081491 RepID=A0A8J5XPN1_DIALT|nr:hypothetical protein KFE25_002997 [Diacronema lutheri]
MGAPDNMNLTRTSQRTVLPDEPREPPVFLSREERLRRFKLDVGVESLHWHDCTPGGEYTKKLTIKNLGAEVQKLRYRLPATTFFSMGFPEPFKLSSGMSRTLEVSFRPIRKEPYDDYIEVFTAKGSMFIPIKATIPSTELAVPTNLDFGFWPVHERTTRTFMVRNLGELPASFRWESHAPFTIEPAGGTLPPYGKQALRITFAPTEAVATVAHFTCVQYDQNGELTRLRYPMRVGGIGKLPFVSVMSETLDFGQVLTGTPASRMFRLRNAAQVHATYAITRDEKDREPVFHFQPAVGTVPADGLKILTVTYRPRHSATRSEEHYTVRTPGGNELRLTLIGEAVGPRVELSATSLDFGDVELVQPRRAVSRVLTISNAADAPTRYQLLTDVNACFGVEKGATGVIGARSSASATLVFRPGFVANFYRRVTVLVENQAAQFVDCLGSAFSDRTSADKRRPAPLKQRHVDNYHRRVLFGWQRVPMDALDERRDELAELLEAHADISDERSEEAVFAQLFGVGARQRAPVYLDDDHADFGGARGDARRVRIVNSTAAKVACVWVVPSQYHIGARGAAGGSGAQHWPPSPFAVEPAEIDVPAHGSAVVTVTFSPSGAGSYYAQELECFAFFKSMRTFRLVSEANFTPPWALVLSATGHSFHGAVPSWVPRASFSLQSVTFPATHVGGAAHQTVALRNEGDTPLSFAFTPDPTATFAARPARGVLERGDFCLVALRFEPRAPGQLRRSLRCVLNGSAATTLQLQLHGQGESAAVELADDGELFFRRTAVGVTSSATHALINRGRAPLAYQILIPEHQRAVLAVDRPMGELEGNERLELRWTFAPQRAKRYAIAVPVLVSAALRAATGSGVLREVQRALLLVRGEGGVGALKAEPRVVDFHTILVGDMSVQRFLLKNSSEVDLHYELDFEVVRAGADGGACEDDADASARTGVLAGAGAHTAATAATANGGGGGDNAPYLEAARALLCEEQRGVLPARTVRPIKLQMQPIRRGDLSYECYAVFSTEPLPGAGVADAERHERPARREHLCRIRGRGDYPILQLADVRLAGCEQVQLARLWRLQDLNRELREELSDVEAQLNSTSANAMVSAGDVGSLGAMLHNLEVLFEPRPVGSEPQVAHALLSNGGGLPVEWSIRYPTEMELEVEHWADKGEPTAAELKQHMIVNRRIFTVFPRSGKLAVGESTRVEIVMSHQRVDRSYEMPLLLTIALGKRLVLRLVGRTLAPSDRVLFLPHATVPLEAVPLGLAHAPVQHVPLRNHCATPLVYRVDTAESERLSAANFGFPVFVVENPQGAILPGQTTNLRVRFHPLEARVYTVELPIVLSGGHGGDDLGVGGVRGAPGGAEPATLVLSARGYHPAGEARTSGETTGFIRTVLPAHQLVVPPGQRGALSCDFIDIGHVPLQAVVTRAVFVRNTSTDPLAFSWSHRHRDFELLASVEPTDGFVAPGESALCRVRVCADTRPEVLDLSLVCTISAAPAAAFWEATTGGGGALGASMRSGATEVSFAALLHSAHGSRATLASAGSRRSAAASLQASVRTRGGARTTVVAWRAQNAQVGGPRAPPHARAPKAEYGELPQGPYAPGSAVHAAIARSAEASSRHGGGSHDGGGSQYGGSILQLPAEGGGAGALALARTASQRSTRSVCSGVAGTSAPTVVSGFREASDMQASELFLNVRGVVLEMGHFKAYQPHRLPEMHIIVGPQRPLEPSLAPAPRPASPPLPLAAREMPFAAMPRAAHAASAARAEEERETAEAIIETLLLDLVSDSDVQRALAHAPLEPIPWFAQLRNAPADFAFPPMQPPPLYAPLAHGARKPAPPVVAALAKQLAAPSFEEARLREALSETHEFHSLAEELLEGSLFNLIAEAVLGEFDVTKPPRQIVTNLELSDSPVARDVASRGEGRRPRPHGDEVALPEMYDAAPHEVDGAELDGWDDRDASQLGPPATDGS